jgi:hypothetical protein
MAAVPTPDEIAEILGTEFDDAAETACQYYIDNAIGEIETYLGRPVSVTEFTDEEHFPDHNGTIYLNTTPVVDVSAVTVDGEVVDVADYIVTAYGIENIWDVLGFSTGFGISDTVTGEPVFLVTYTAGLDFPASVRSLVMNGVLGAMGARSTGTVAYASGTVGARRISVEDYEIDFGTSSASTGISGGGSKRIFSDDDLRILNRLKRRAVG